MTRQFRGQHGLALGGGQGRIQPAIARLDTAIGRHRQRRVRGAKFQRQLAIGLHDDQQFLGGGAGRQRQGARFRLAVRQPAVLDVELYRLLWGGWQVETAIGGAAHVRVQGIGIDGVGRIAGIADADLDGAGAVVQGADRYLCLIGPGPVVMLAALAPFGMACQQRTALHGLDADGKDMAQVAGIRAAIARVAVAGCAIQVADVCDRQGTHLAVLGK
ncbi:hypothetical protein D3C72_1604380 [compost metagenome]